MGIVKIYFQPNVDIRTPPPRSPRSRRRILKQMPPGTTPPLILNYNASTVPILQLASSSKTLSEQQVLDLTQNFMRPALSTVPGAAIPYPYGGKVRQVQIDLDPQALQAKGLSAQDVENAIATQNQILPAGTVKIGSLQYTVKLNDAPDTIEELNDLPIKTVERRHHLSCAMSAMCATARRRSRASCMSTAQRAVLTTILKTGSASTLAVVQGVKNALPQLHRDALPAELQDRPAQRSVAVREGGDLGRGPRRRDRRGPDQPDDPAVPGQLALDPDHRHLDSAGGALRADGAFARRARPSTS